MLKKTYLPLFALGCLSVVAAVMMTVWQLTGTADQSGEVAAATTGGSADIYLDPAAKTFVSGQLGRVSLMMNGGQSVIDGVQIVATLTGQIPSDVSFVPTVPAGFQLVSNEISHSASASILRIAMVSSSPSVGVTTQNQAVVLGTLGFTAPSGGTFQVAFDPSQSKVIQHSTVADILKIPAIGQYTFGVAVPTPSPVASPVASPTPVIPSPSVIVKPSATPLPTIAPTAKPSPTPVPSSSVIETASAQWTGGFFRWSILTVKAKVSGNQAAPVGVVGYGNLKYQKRTGWYSQTFIVKSKPSEVMIKTADGVTKNIPVVSGIKLK